MKRAAQVASWHLYEVRRLIESDQEPAAEYDAITLIEWIKKQGLSETTRTHISQYAPYAIRKSNKRDGAIAVLSNRGYMREMTIDGKKTLVINPKILETAT